MADESKINPKFLAPPAVTALRQEAARDNSPTRVQMERTLSEDIREEREELKQAAEQSLNVILDLGLDGNVRWVSPSWTEVIGTPIETVQGKPITNILLEKQNVFQEAVEAMKKDDSKSQIIRFPVRMGQMSVLRTGLPAGEIGSETIESPATDGDLLQLEGQGIMVYDRASGGESHVSSINCM